MNRQHCRGFTLIELLAAIAIFSLLAVAMYGGTQWIMVEREIVQERQEALRDLQRAVLTLNDDFGQLRLRPIRDELGRGTVPALIAEPGQDYIVELSHDGWRNPAQAVRGTLQRVRYRLEEEEAPDDFDSRRDEEERFVLIREYWPVMDRVLGMEARSQEVLRGIREFEIEYLDEGQQWQENWPPLGSEGVDLTSLPLGVRYRLETDAFGEIIRLVEVPR